MHKRVTLLALVALLLAGCGTSMRLPDAASLGEVNPDPHHTWHFERSESIDDQKLDSGSLSFDAPALSPDERSITLLATRLRWTETADSPLETHELRLHELPSGALVDSRPISEAEADAWRTARWDRERVASDSSPLPNARSPWRFEAKQSWTLINDATGQRHEIFSPSDYRSEDHGYCFSPDGSYLVGWFIGGRFMFPKGGDQTKSHIRVWDVATGQLRTWWRIDQQGWCDGSCPAGFIAGTNVMVFRGRGWASLFDLDDRKQLDTAGMYGDTIVTSDSKTVVLEWRGVHIYRVVPPSTVKPR